MLVFVFRVRLSASGAAARGAWSRAGRCREECACKRMTTRTRPPRTVWRERSLRNRVNGMEAIKPRTEIAKCERNFCKRRFLNIALNLKQTDTNR